jgi:hypothetical protein
LATGCFANCHSVNHVLHLFLIGARLHRQAPELGALRWNLAQGFLKGVADL